MTTAPFKNSFVDRLLAEGEAKGKAEGEAKGLAEGEAKGKAEGEAKGLAEGKAEGEARVVLRVLSARGLGVPAEIRQRVLSCADTTQLEAWADRAATAVTLDDVFGT